MRINSIHPLLLIAFRDSNIAIKLYIIVILFYVLCSYNYYFLIPENRSKFKKKIIINKRYRYNFYSSILETVKEKHLCLLIFLYIFFESSRKAGSTFFFFRISFSKLILNSHAPSVGRLSV